MELYKNCGNRYVKAKIMYAKKV